MDFLLREFQDSFVATTNGGRRNGQDPPVCPTPELGQAIDGHLDHLTDAMAPWSADGGYFNFAERECGVDTILPAAVCERLGEVKHRWDPDGLIRSNHAVAVAPA